MCTCTTRWHMWLCYYGNRSNIGCEHVYMYVQRHDTCDYVTTVTGLKSSIGYVHVYSEMMIALYSAILRSRAERCTYSAGMAGATWNCCRLGASSVYTIQPCTVLLYVCLAITCHLHFWQNDRDLLRAVTQNRKLTMEKKNLPPLLQGCEPATFQSRVRRSNHRAIPLPG